MSEIETAALVVGRSPAARAARGGTEGRRGHQKRKARAKPEPLKEPRSSWPQRVSAGRAVERGPGRRSGDVDAMTVVLNAVSVGSVVVRQPV